MNDLKRDSLQIILNNEVILAALRDVFNETANELMPHIAYGESDEVVGQKYRSYDTAKSLIANAFLKLESYRKSSTSGTGDVRHI